MDVKELNSTIDSIDTQVANAARGDDTKILVGLLARGIWEVARQVALLQAEFEYQASRKPL